MKAVKLKLGTHMDKGLMYRVYQKQGQGPITLGLTSLDRFYNLPIRKNFSHFFLKNCKGYKVETWYSKDPIYRGPRGPKSANAI